MAMDLEIMVEVIWEIKVEVIQEPEILVQGVTWVRV